MAKLQYYSGVWMDWRKPTETVWLAGLRAEIWTLNFSRKQETIRQTFDAVGLGLVYETCQESKDT